jgi:predicted DNA-binding protein
MTLRSDGRRVISVTMQPDLYDQLYARCKELDRPITVFVREAIKSALLPRAEAKP